MELDVIAFAENPAALDFEDGSEILPRGVQLEVLLAQCSMHLGTGQTSQCTRLDLLCGHPFFGGSSF